MTTELDVLKALKAARDLLAKPGAWTKGWFARDAVGRRTGSRNELAVCWCASGAVFRVAGGATRYAALAVLAKEVGGPIVEFNDAQESVEPVLEVFDKAIAKLEASR